MEIPKAVPVKRKILEKDVEKHFRNQVKRRGGVSYKWSSPSVRGVPDRIVVWPGGIVWFVELKTKGGVVSELQKAFFRLMASLGMARCAVLWTKEQVDEWVEKSAPK